MKRILVFTLFITTVLSCQNRNETQFSLEALNDKLINLQGDSVSFKFILEKHKGSTVLIDVWASWCGDCIKGLPSVRNLQKEYPEVVFLFLSVDENKDAWRKGIERFQIKGAHYNLPKGMKTGDFVDFINLSWIPRYMVIDAQGKITLFKATSASDSAIVAALKFGI